MEKIVFKNRFRILDPNGKVVYLNSIYNIKGNAQYVMGFDKLTEAQAARRIYVGTIGGDIEDYPIESYSESVSHSVPLVSKEANDEIYRRRLFSGRGLKYNTITPRSQENRYNPSKYYGRQVWMQQSTERSKGVSVIHSKRHKKKPSYSDIETFDKVEKLRNQATFDLSYSLIESLKRHGFENRKALKDYLKSRGYTNSQIKRLSAQYYYTK